MGAKNDANTGRPYHRRRASESRVREEIVGRRSGKRGKCNGRVRATVLALGVVASFARVGAVRAASPYEDPYEMPTTPRSPTLPPLTHSETEATVETTIGALIPERGPKSGELQRSLGFVERLNVELPVAKRQWFLGSNYEFAVGAPPSGGGALQLVGGNLEVYGRVVWAMRTGLAFGGGLGVMAPTSSFDPDSPASRVATAAATIRPWDYSFFRQDAFGLRPYFDVRAVDGRFVIQFRQGIDYAVELSGLAQKTFAATGALYLGYRVASWLGAGVEVLEYYVLDDSVKDAKRATFTFSPSVRFMTKHMQPSVSGFTNVGGLPYDGVSRIWGMRLAFTVLFEAPTL